MRRIWEENPFFLCKEEPKKAVRGAADEAPAAEEALGWADGELEAAMAGEFMVGAAAAMAIAENVYAENKTQERVRNI